MTPYKAHSGDSGVKAYAIKNDSLVVQFVDGSIYKYDYKNTGKNNIEEMKRLAKEGRGLATFINKHVREKYAARIT